MSARKRCQGGEGGSLGIGGMEWGNGTCGMEGEGEEGGSTCRETGGRVNEFSYEFQFLSFGVMATQTTCSVKTSLCSGKYQRVVFWIN